MLSKACGSNLRAAANFKNSVILARLKDAPNQAMLDHLAESLYAKWVPQDDGSLLLTNDYAALRRRDQDKADAYRLKLENSYRYLDRRLSEQPAELDAKFIQNYRLKVEREQARRKAAELANDYANMFVGTDSMEEAPGWRASAKLLKIITANYLLNLPNDSVQVWAESPTPMQLAFPIGTKPILDQYRREFSLLKPEEQITRIKFLVKRWEIGGSFNAAIIAYGADNKEVDHQYVRLNDDGDQMKIPYSQRKVIPAKEGETPIVVTAESLEARNALSLEGEKNQGAELKAKWRTRLLDPVLYEPTQWHAGADFIAVAEALNRNLIGTVYDYIGAAYWQNTPKTPTQFLRQNTASLREKTDGWIVACPTEEWGNDSREKGKALIDASVRDGGVSVDAAAEWVGNSSARFPSVLWVGDYLTYFFSGQGPYSVLATIMNVGPLKIWNSLGANTRLALRQGNTLSVSNMSRNTKSLLFQMVYWNEDSTDLDDPTDQLPNGLTNGTVSLTIKEKQILEAWSATKGPPASGGPMDSEMFGAALAKGGTGSEESAEKFQSYDRFRIGINRTYTLHFTFQPGNVPVKMELSESFLDPAGKVLTKLPADMAAEVERARRETLAKPAKQERKTTTPPPFLSPTLFNP